MMKWAPAYPYPMLQNKVPGKVKPCIAFHKSNGWNRHMLRAAYIVQGSLILQVVSVPKPPLFKGQLYRHTWFYCTLLYCAPPRLPFLFLFFKQIDGKILL